MWEGRGAFLYNVDAGGDIAAQALTLGHLAHIWARAGLSFSLVRPGNVTTLQRRIQFCLSCSLASPGKVTTLQRRILLSLSFSLVGSRSPAACIERRVCEPGDSGTVTSCKHLDLDFAQLPGVRCDVRVCASRHV